MSDGALRRVLIGGGSMAPTLEVGDVALVREGARARVGDVVVIASRGAPICHRVVLLVPWRRGVRLVHLGDAPGAAPGVGGEVIGRVVAVERHGRAVPIARRWPRPRELARAARALLRAALTRIP